jgi:hypothetical protein
MYRTTWAALCAAVLAIGLATAASADAATNPDDGSNILPTGHCLRVVGPRDDARLETANQRFTLYVSNSDITIQNDVDPGHSHDAESPIWDRYGPGARRGSLCMHPSGNLVFRSGGDVVWSSHTRGSGRHNYAKLLATGSLVVRTRTGRTVWSTHTSAVLMKPGDRLDSGHRLVNRTYPGHTTKLEMRHGGDLVLLESGQPVWRTGTHRSGAYLTVTRAGRMAVRTSAGHTVWRSPAVGRHPVLSVDQLGSISLWNQVAHGRCWDRPAGRGCV